MAGISYVTLDATIAASAEGSLATVKTALQQLSTRVNTISATYTSTVPGTLLTYIEELRLALITAGILHT